jgi:hypothetical protein
MSIFIILINRITLKGITANNEFGFNLKTCKNSLPRSGDFPEFLGI